MKKYYCPYCGELTRKWYHKLNSRATNITAKMQKHCTACNRFIPVKSHFSVWIIFVLPICLFCASLYLFVTGKVMYGYVCFFLYVVLQLIEFIVDVIFRKFVKYNDDAKTDRYYQCSVDLTDEVKHPKLYFYGTSVVLLKFERSPKPIPVRIEATEIRDKHCKCKIAFVLQKPEFEFAGKSFTLLDNDKVIGTGNFE